MYPIGEVDDVYGERCFLSVPIKVGGAQDLKVTFIAHKVYLI